MRIDSVPWGNLDWTPQIFRDILAAKSGLLGLIGAFSEHNQAFLGPIGTNSSTPHSPGGRAEMPPKRGLVARIGAFSALRTAGAKDEAHRFP